jgi:hypothetical protein
VKDVKNNETNNTTGQAANAAIRAAMHRNGGEFPVDVEDKTSPKADTKGRGKKSHGYVAPSKVHQDAADTVSSMMRAKNVTPEPNAPISADGDDVVDASGRDYREVVELRPETVPRTAAGKPSRYAKRKRGESPGSYRGATDMSEYHTRKGKGKGKGKKDDTKSDKPEWTEYQTQCHALRRDGKQCGNKSRKGSKFCHLLEHQPAKTGVPDYADDPAYTTNDDDQANAEEYTGPLPEALRKPLLWVWGNFYTPFSWMVVWVFATAMSAKGKAGSAVLAPYHLMRYCTDSVACKWRWRQTVAILAQAMERDQPLLGTNQVLQVLGTHRQIRNTNVVRDPKLLKRVSNGLANKDSGKWKGRHGSTWAKTAARFFDQTVEQRYEENLAKAFLDPNGPNSHCQGIEKFVKDDGTPNIKAARQKFKRSLTTINMLREKKGVSSLFYSPLYEFCCEKPTTVTVKFGEGKATAYTKAEFIDAYVKQMRTTKTDIFDVFYLVNEDATCLRSGKKVNDPVIIQVAVYSVEKNGVDTGKLFLGVGRKTNTGYTGPFESLFMRTSKRSPFEHVWDADDELDVMEVVAESNPEAEKQREDAMMTALREGQVLSWDDIQKMLAA